jgi:dephospho-CoA kinase
MIGQATLQLQCNEPIFVGFIGRIGSGKTSAAKYLMHRYGFQYKRYSQVLAEWTSTNPSDRDRLQQFGWGVMTCGLQSELNARVIAGIDHSRNAAIDGLRHAIDFESLSKAFGSSFHPIFLEARQEIRFERLRSKFSGDESLRAAESAAVEAYIDSLKPLASATIANEEGLESLYLMLDAWIGACEIRESHC